MRFSIIGLFQYFGCPRPWFGSRTARAFAHRLSTDKHRFPRFKCLRNIDVQRVEDIRLFNYGEPLLHPQLEVRGGILRDEAPFEIGVVELSTNAQSKSYRRLEALVDTGILNRLAISCDGDGTPESYEAVRPPAKWDQLMAFLAFAKELQERHPTLQLMARSVIRTSEDARRWREVLAPFGVEPKFRGWKYLPQSSQNMTGRKTRVGVGVCVHVAERDRLYVNNRGEVVPCCVHPRAGVFGNLGESRHSEILAAAQRQAFVDQMVHDRSGMSVCGICEFGPANDRGPSAGVGLDFEP